MVKAGTVDKAELTTADDRTALDLHERPGAVLQTGLGLIREVKTNNPDLYNNMAVALLPVGKSSVIRRASMAISVKGDTKFPNASKALAQFFTNPRA